MILIEPYAYSRKPRKNSRKSSTNSSGSSNAAKWPPRGIFVHRFRCILRSAHSRGNGTSAGNDATAAGTWLRIGFVIGDRSYLERAFQIHLDSRVNRFGYPINHDIGKYFILRKPLFDVAFAIAPSVELFDNPRCQAIAKDLRLGRFDHNVGTFCKQPTLSETGKLSFGFRRMEQSYCPVG